jgi:hypothetical protein
MSTNLMEASAQWASRPADQRFPNLEALLKSVQARRMLSRSIDIDTGKTHVDSRDGVLTINGTITPCEPTHWSFGQLSQSIGAPTSYLRTLPQDLLVENINHGLKTHPGGEMKFMTIAREDSPVNTLQAITSTTYGRIWDYDVCQAVGRIVEQSGGKFHNPLAYAIDTSRTERAGLYASDRDCFLFMIDVGSRLEAGPRAQLNRGFFVWNSETGSRSFGLMTFLFNQVCGNNIVWGASDIQRLVIRHTSGGPYRFAAEAAPTLLAYANASAAPIESAVRRAQDKVLWDGREASMPDLLEALSKRAKFSRAEVSQAIAFAKAEEGQARTVWDFVQGFTAYARGFDWVDARVDLETRAGKLMDLAA